MAETRDNQDRARSGDDWERFAREVGAKEARKVRARRSADRSPWFWAGMFGLVGWSVAGPTILGVYIGWLIDRAGSPGPWSWTLLGLVVGVSFGCLNAWYWVSRESRRKQ